MPQLLLAAPNKGLAWLQKEENIVGKLNIYFLLL
jgi:hypothetical protein